MQKALLLLILLLNAVSISVIPFTFQVWSHDYVLYQVVGLVFGFISFTYCILLMPDSPWSYYINDDFQRTRAVMQGVLQMNGANNTRLLFRFKNETLNEYNAVIYDLSRDEGYNPSSALSTNLETVIDRNTYINLQN